MKKLLLALQFWDGDRAQAMQLAKFIAALEPRHSEFADFMFVARFDSSHDEQATQAIAAKFDTHTFKTRRKAVGWPYGCNEMWFDLMTYVCEKRMAKQLPDYKAILTFEADCVPLIPGWIETLSREWDTKQVKVLGCQVPPGPKITGGVHINGNALFSGDMEFLQAIRSKAGCAPDSGWDFKLAGFLRDLGWANTQRIVSHWRRDSVSQQEYVQCCLDGTVLFHGIKNASLLNLVAAKYLPSPVSLIKNADSK